MFTMERIERIPVISLISKQKYLKPILKEGENISTRSVLAVIETEDTLCKYLT
jgi:hypothetical protein